MADKKLTKLQLIHRYHELMEEAQEKQIFDRLVELVHQDKITAGAAYYIHNPWDWYSADAIRNILLKAGEAKNYLRAIKRTSHFTYTYHITEIEKNLKAAMDFLEEQESLPFEQTQKQVLKREGKLWGDKKEE